jgi:ATP-dependent DNA helicase RecG
LKALTIDDFLIVDALLHERKLSDYLKKRIKGLINLGVVERVGRSKFVITDSFYKVAGRPSVRSQSAELNRETCKELIYNHLLNNRDKGMPFREIQLLLPSYSRKQVQLLLTDLRNENRIKWLVKQMQLDGL